MLPLAEVAELADALRSGRSGCKAVWVQLPASALARDPGFSGIFLLGCVGLGLRYHLGQERNLTRTSKRNSGRPPLTLLQVLTLVGVVAGLLIVLDFNQRLAVA